MSWALIPIAEKVMTDGTIPAAVPQVSWPYVRPQAPEYIPQLPRQKGTPLVMRTVMHAWVSVKLPSMTILCNIINDFKKRRHGSKRVERRISSLNAGPVTFWDIQSVLSKEFSGCRH